MFRHSLTATFTAFALAIVLGQSQAQAQVKPFKITGSGVAPLGLPAPGGPALPHSIVGNATQLGKHYGMGTVELNTFVPNSDYSIITGEFGSGSPFEFVGANGDILSCWYGRTDHGATSPGSYMLVSTGEPDMYIAYFIAEFVPFDPECTGKFTGVTGSWIMYAVTDPFLLGSDSPVNYSWQGSGYLTYQQGK
jgi:hypothetical protein